MLTCTLETRTNKSFVFRAHIELSVMGYNPLPRKLDTVALTSQLSVMVLLCCFVHYIVIRVLKRSGLDAPCSCPARCRKHAVPGIGSTIELNEKDRADRLDSLKAELKESDMWNSRGSEGGSEGGGNESQSGYSSPVEDLADLTQQDIENDQDVKDRELLEALQRERETVAVLYSELEQERNCSATAASEAMAMISRLQEEKAAVQMEARQFERMVVEKAMYDQEAIEALNELLFSREQERIALGEEILLCKEKLDALVREERKQLLLSEAKADEGRVFPKLESPILVKNEKIDTASWGGRDEQSKYVDKFSTTNSQLLTALVQDGGRGMEAQLGRRLSTSIRRKGGKSEETDGGKPEFSEKIDTAPRTGRDEESKYVDKVSKYVDKVSTTNSQLLTALVQDGGRGMETQLGRRLSNGIRRKGGKSEEADGGEPEFSEKIDTAPRAGRDEQSKYVDKVGTTNSQLLTATVQDGDRGTEAQLGVRPSNGISRKGGKSEAADDGKPEFSGFVSLKRRWGSQEITLKTLEQAKEERRLEDKKRLSVLEYVMKFEQQQQHGVRPPVQMPSVMKHPESARGFRSKMRSYDVYNKPGQATVRAASNGSLWVLEREAFRGVLLMKYMKRPSLKILRSVETFSKLSLSHLHSLSEAFTEVTFEEGQVLVAVDERVDAFYVVNRGDVHVTYHDGENVDAGEFQLPRASLEWTGERCAFIDHGDHGRDIPQVKYFGDWVLTKAPAKPITVAITGTECWYITRQAFEEAFVPISTILK